jgi:hypothetical protein
MDGCTPPRTQGEGGGGKQARGAYCAEYALEISCGMHLPEAPEASASPFAHYICVPPLNHFFAQLQTEQRRRTKSHETTPPFPFGGRGAYFC